MKFALVSTHDQHGSRFHLNGEREDATSFLSWVSILSGFHFNFKRLKTEGFSVLKDFDLVMFSGHPSHIVDIIEMARALKDSKTVTMFYPEGSAQLYDYSIRTFHREYYDAWNACDILSIVEEDKQSYYENFVTKETLVRFIHVPTTPAMSEGRFFVPSESKKLNRVLVYGDNNPNHPLIAMAAARAINAEVLAVECGNKENEEAIQAVLPGLRIFSTYKIPHNELLRQLGRTGIHFYPTEWFGTARQVISCASVGTPCIGPEQSHTQMRLFPSLAVKNHWDIDGMVGKAKELLMNKEFFDLAAKTAFDASQFYNITNTKKRLLSAYEKAVSNKSEMAVR